MGSCSSHPQSSTLGRTSSPQKDKTKSKAPRGSHAEKVAPPFRAFTLLEKHQQQEAEQRRREQAMDEYEENIKNDCEWCPPPISRAASERIFERSRHNGSSEIVPCVSSSNGGGPTPLATRTGKKRVTFGGNECRKYRVDLGGLRV